MLSLGMHACVHKYSEEKKFLLSNKFEKSCVKHSKVSVTENLLHFPELEFLRRRVFC